MRRTLSLILGLCCTPLAVGSTQTSWDPNAITYSGPPSWQRAAVAALNRHLPTDSGFFVLGPLDLRVDLPDTTRLLDTTLRILAPDPAASREVSRRLRLATGGVMLEELQPADTLLHELPPGYPGRLLKGSIVGSPTYVQVMTIHEHRWLLWAQRSRFHAITHRVTGPLARYSSALSTHLKALESGSARPEPPEATRYDLDPAFEFYARPPEPVIRSREGFEQLLAQHNTLTIAGLVEGVNGFIPGPELATRMRESADRVLFINKSGEAALQHRYRDYEGSAGRWDGLPLMSPAALRASRPGRYLYAVDRYGYMRIGPWRGAHDEPGSLSTSMLVHGDPVLVAGQIVVERADRGSMRVREIDIASEDYLFSNRALTLYEDVEKRSDRYGGALIHAIDALERANVPTDDVLLRKF